MGMGVNVNLPVIVSFLLLYSLKRGAIIVCTWTMFRSLFCLVFFMWSTIDEFLPFCPRSVLRQKPITYDDDYCTNFYYILYLSYTGMIVMEAILFIFSITLAMGIFGASALQIAYYLVCRFIIWCLEIILLTLITLIQDESKGWYLIFLMIIILELYGFVVVYSYRKEIIEIANRTMVAKGLRDGNR